MGLAFDATGNLYVSDITANAIMKYPVVGGVLSGSGTTFTTSGLNSPIGLAFDGGGNLYAANQAAPTLEKFTSTGGVLSPTGTVFASGGALNSPSYLAFTPAPEPGTASLTLLGGLALLRRQRVR